MRKGLLIFEEMRKYLVIFERPLVIYDLATAPVWISLYSIWGQFNFFFISVLTDLIPPHTPQSARFTILSSKLGPPNHLTRIASPPLGSRGETQSHAEEGVGGPNSDDETCRHSGDTIPLRYITAHYQHYTFLGDVDSAIQICLPILHRKAMYENACYPIKETQS